MIRRLRALWAELIAIGDPVDVDLDQPDYVSTYYDFWQRIVEHPDGTLNMDQLMRELADYHEFLNDARQVYSHVTDGRISKPNTSASAVIAEADDYTNRLVAEALRDATTPAQWLEQQAGEYAAACNNPALRAHTPPVPAYLADPYAQLLPAVDDMPALRERLQAVLAEHAPTGTYEAARDSAGKSACGHDPATDDNYNDHHEPNDNGVWLCLDQRTSLVCSNHHGDETDHVPYPCDVVIETRAALGMPALNLEGADRGC